MSSGSFVNFALGLLEVVKKNYKRLGNTAIKIEACPTLTRSSPVSSLFMKLSASMSTPKYKMFSHSAKSSFIAYKYSSAREKDLEV